MLRKSDRQQLHHPCNANNRILCTFLHRLKQNIWQICKQTKQEFFTMGVMCENAPLMIKTLLLKVRYYSKMVKKLDFAVLQFLKAKWRCVYYMDKQHHLSGYKLLTSNFLQFVPSLCLLHVYVNKVLLVLQSYINIRIL